MTPWLPWVKYDFGVGDVFVVGDDSLAMLFNNENVIPVAVLSAGTPFAWSRARLFAVVYQKIMVAAAGAGMPLAPHASQHDFLQQLREALGQLSQWPAVAASELEYAAEIDFTTPQCAPFKYLQFMEHVSIQMLRDLNTLRKTGWGVLAFSLSPCWDVADKFGDDQ